MALSKQHLKKLFIVLLTLFVISGSVIFLVDWHVRTVSSPYIVALEDTPEADAVLVLGAYVYPNGKPSDMLHDRLNVAIDLYQNHNVVKFLVSGDHGRTDYDEVNAMKQFVVNHNIPPQNVFMDHAGFSTYESIYRARDIFQVKKVIIVTQRYHLMRAIYIARSMGLEAYGVPSDLQTYRGMDYYELREIAARNKDFLLVNVFKPEPTFLGDAIPISGDGRATDD